MPRARTPVAAFCLFLMVVAAPTFAHPQSSGGADAPPVTVYVRVLTDAGEPVTDIKAADLSVKIAGQPRPIRSIDLLAGRKTALSGPAPSALPAPFATNEGAGAGRDLIIVVDDSSVPPASLASLQDALRRLVSGLGPMDRVGLLSARGGGVNIGLTPRHDTVLTAIGAFKTQNRATEPCRAGSILETLKNLVASLQGSSPTTVVFFSTGAMTDGCSIQMDDWRAFSAAVQRTFTTFYVAQVFEGDVRRSAFLDNLSGMSGAEMVRLTADASPAMARIARETSVAYRVQIEPDRSDRVGTTQRFEMRTTRTGVKVSAPSSITFAPADKNTSRSATPSAMLRGPAPAPDLGLRVSALLSRNPTDDKVKVVAMFEPTDPSAKIASAMAAIFDEREQSVAQWTARRSDLSRAPVMAALPVPAGTYRLRVAAVDAAGRGGVADLEVTAALTKAEPLGLSTIVLGAMSNEGLAPRLLFGSEPAAFAYFEIYGTAAGMLSARFEIAPSETGPAIAAVPAQIGRTATETLRTATASLPIAALPAGDVLIRAIVSLDGQPIGRISRTLRKR